MSMGDIGRASCSIHGRYSFDLATGNPGCPKCGIKKSMTGEIYMKNNIQNAIDQVGIEAVAKSLGHTPLGNCDMHGMYVDNGAIGCPLCPPANGTAATEVEHYINLKELLDPASGHNPGQVVNPTGISQQDITNAYRDAKEREGKA